MAPLRVLLIDDEEELVVTLAERMMLRGIEVEGVTSGADAIGRVQLVKFDVVVLDMKMPGIGGLEVMRRIRKEQQGIKFLLMTERGALEEGEEGMQEGAFAYLLKPINIEDLMKKMMEAVGVLRETFTGKGPGLLREYYGKFFSRDQQYHGHYR